MGRRRIPCQILKPFVRRLSTKSSRMVSKASTKSNSPKLKPWKKTPCPLKKSSRLRKKRKKTLLSCIKFQAFNFQKAQKINKKKKLPFYYNYIDYTDDDISISLPHIVLTAFTSLFRDLFLSGCQIETKDNWGIIQ